MKTLRISSDLALPADMITQASAVVGVRGSGKTTTAVDVAEELLELGHQVVIIDPLDVWRGLKSSKDGKSAGYPIAVLGGEHGDVPIYPDSGKTVADFVVDHRAPAILSLRHFDSKADERRFVTDFAARLYARKGKSEHRSPVLVIIDEASLFVPQRVTGDQARMVGAIQNLVRQGRVSGIGVMLIDQRPATINKDVLTQVEMLIVHRITNPHDRKAIADWLEYQGGGSKDVLQSLQLLGRGEAWVWSPSWLDLLQRVQMRDRRTFDSSSTPKLGEKTATAQKVAPIDLEALSVALSSEVEKARGEDPRELRKRVAELERQLAQKPAGAIGEKELQRAVAQAVAEKEREIADLTRELRDVNHIAAREVTRVLDSFEKATTDLSGLSRVLCARADGSEEALREVKKATNPPAPRQMPVMTRTAAAALRPVKSNPEGLSGPEQRILDAVAWMEAIGISDPEQTAVAFLAGYTIGGGAFNNPRGALRTKGLIDYRGGAIVLTEAGRAKANWPDSALTADELQRRVLERLPGPEQRILRVLLEVYPHAIENDVLAQRAGYEPRGGAFNNPRGRLRSLGLIDYPERGRVAARPLLFLEERRA